MDIDHAVAEKVMGWYQDHSCKENKGKWFCGDECMEFTGYLVLPSEEYRRVLNPIYYWNPSEQTNQAFEVVDRLIEIGIKKISVSYNHYLDVENGNWVCDIEKMNIIIRDITKEMAICHAALQAMEGN